MVMNMKQAWPLYEVETDKPGRQRMIEQIEMASTHEMASTYEMTSYTSWPRTRVDLVHMT